jgi:hypothetical protein
MFRFLLSSISFWQGRSGPQDAGQTGPGIHPRVRSPVESSQQVSQIQGHTSIRVELESELTSWSATLSSEVSLVEGKNELDELDE